jgi:hypothetical protein
MMVVVIDGMGVIDDVWIDFSYRYNSFEAGGAARQKPLDRRFWRKVSVFDFFVSSSHLPVLFNSACGIKISISIQNHDVQYY